MKKKQIKLLSLLVTTFLTSPMSAMECNNSSIGLLILPDEMLEPLFFKSITEGRLEDGIKTALQLSKTCKYINALLIPENVGKSCRHYKQEDKDETLKKLLKQINDRTYWNKRHAALILAYAGANDIGDSLLLIDSLLLTAVVKNDTAMVTALFENNANQITKSLSENSSHLKKPIRTS